MSNPDPGSAATVEGRFARVSGALLVGGASSRMGRDKAHLPVEGELLAVRLARILADLCEDVVLVGGDPPAEAPGRRVADPEGERSALRGLVGALEAARGDRVLVVATDLPYLSHEILLALLALPSADAVVPRDADRIHPLCGLYRRESVLPVARRHLEAGELALHRLLGAVDVRFLEGPSLEALAPGGRTLTNWNRPEDLPAGLPA